MLGTPLINYGARIDDRSGSVDCLDNIPRTLPPSG